jgi:toxin-antitoxin system PIN domain toxin
VRPALLDVNLLVALFDPDHVHHETAHDWFADNASEGWATCPMTENGFVRVLANPAYGGTSRPSELVGRLRRFCKGPRYQFWTDDISLRDETLFDPAFLTSHRQLTDIYLLGLAKKRGGRLATFDRTIPVKAIVGGRRELLEVVGRQE